MKRISTLLLSASLITVLGACQKDNSTASTSENKEIQTEDVAKDATIIRGKGEPRLMSTFPMITLNPGKATIKVKVKDLNKSETFSAAVFQHLEGTGSTTSIASVSGKGDFSQSESFDVPSEGNYDVNISGYKISPDFKGDWEVSIEQKPKKEKGYDKQLRLTNITQQIGGEFDSSTAPKDEYKKDAGYGAAMSNFTILDKNSISFQTLKDGKFVITEMKNGKWTKVEKDTGKTQSYIDEAREKYSDFDYISDISTNKGAGVLVSYGGKHYIVFENLNAAPEEVKITGELANLLLSKDEKDVYWNFDNKMVYTIVTDYRSDEKNKWLMHRYDLNKQKFIADANGSQTTPMPFGHTSERMRFANDKKGNLYIASLPASATDGSNSYSVTVATFNKDMKMLAKPTRVSAIYDYFDKGRFEIAATDKGVDIWNVYDARVVNGNSYTEPLKVGANRFSLTLQ
ncbi:hypothetical protein [Bacillus cereus group sp. TH152-1LC]|uniref:hypothetical protein n=1 Tax=Bacillus cereus group sp. TH152-1LC TaxID=3018060 RepID=UPI0022E922FB|nr:hypothetical protein [Bacillus cereus group sp. TH152-1LC]MDA1675580.1 hypothetical protein [Bacillus cereus group sp. TH152-1LC]